MDNKKSLLVRRFYSIDGAAKNLNIEVEEIEYHLSEGNLRYAFPNSDKVNNFYAWFRFDELSEVIKNCVFECVKRKDWSIVELFKKHELAPLVPDETLSPEFLYLPSSYPSVDGANVGVMNEWDDSPWASAVMELLDGERVIKLAGGYPHYFITGDRSERNIFVDAVITREDLAKFEGGATPEFDPRLDDPEKLDGPFENKVEADEFTRVINYFGNMYFYTKGDLPTAGKLISFICERLDAGMVPKRWSHRESGLLALSISNDRKNLCVGPKSLHVETMKGRIRNATKQWKKMSVS